jgi:stress response protein SCP2
LAINLTKGQRVDIDLQKLGVGSESAYDGQCTMIFGEVYRREGGWKFRALGDAHPYDNFVHLLKSYIQK